MKKIFFELLYRVALFLVSPLLFASLSCNNNPTTYDDIKPGRRDYTWTVDTLIVPFTILESIWGSSASDIWVVGPGGDLDKTIYHYNGISWQTDGISRNISPQSIYGFSSQNIWIAGQGGIIWHYNGNNWTYNIQLHNPFGVDFIVFENIWGDAANNLFAVGSYPDSGGSFNNGIIAHYDGNGWKILNTPHIRASLIKIRMGSKESYKFYILGYREEFSASDTSKIYELVGENIKTIYSGLASSDQLGEMANISDKIFIIRGREISIYLNGEFHKFLTINELNFGNAIWGKSEKDIFFRMQDGIAHYNGSDIKYILNFNSQISINGAAIFEKEIFFLAYDFNKSLNLIIKGKLD